MILYMYDIKFTNKKTFNRLKRRFYYELVKLMTNSGEANLNLITKSTILVPDNKEAAFDSFFKSFKRREGKNLVVFKVFTTNIEEF